MVLPVQPGSEIPHRDPDLPLLLPLSADDQPAGFRFAVCHGIGRVEDEIEQHLLELDPVAHHRRQIGVQFRFNANPPEQDLPLQQGQYVPDKVVDGKGSQLGACPPQEQAQSLNNLVGAPVVRDYVLEDISDFLEVRLILGEKAEGRLRIAHDGGKRLVEFMGQRRRQLSQGRNARDMGKLVPLPLDFEVNPPVLGDVVDEGIEAENAVSLVNMRNIERLNVTAKTVRGGQLSLELDFLSGKGPVNIATKRLISPVTDDLPDGSSSQGIPRNPKPFGIGKVVE